MEIIRLTCIGIVLGLTAVIPGISVATIAVVCNVYDNLIGIITLNVKKIISHWKFLLPLFVGGVIGIIAFSKIITLLFAIYPVPTYWFFIGVILGSLPLVYRRAKRQDSALLSGKSIICCILALALMVLMALMRPAGEAVLYTALTPWLFGMLFFGGFLAALAMIIPGISGSFLLLIIGLYRTIVQSVSVFNIPLMAPVALGALVGLLAGAAFVRFLISKVPFETYGAVLGLVAGSVFVLFPGGMGNGIIVIFSILCLLGGSALSFFTGRGVKKCEPC